MSGGWYNVRDHVASLEGAQLTGFLTDEVTEAWIDFEYRGHAFTINNQLDEYWFFVKDSACPDEILHEVADHFEALLGTKARLPQTAGAEWRQWLGTLKAAIGKLLWRRG
ncbi:MAG: hypothetical protein H6819_12510 [Phycisphaerales bacterium]|nr:hypothetical protein [Phycisphaerales bacterium]